jgi:hypothetical protein
VSWPRAFITWGRVRPTDSLQGVHLDQDVPGGPAHHLRLADARDVFQPAFQEFVGDAGEFPVVHAGVGGVGPEHQGEHRQLGRVELLDDRFLDGVREVTADLADFGPHIVQGLVHVPGDVELDGQGADAFLAGGADFPHLLDGVHRLLDLLDHVLLDRVGACAGVDHAHGDHRHVDLGEAVQPEPLDGKQPHDHERQHDAGGEDRPLDGEIR